MTTLDWRNVITDAREVKLFNALEHPQYVWRTLPALVRESGMNDTEVIAALWKRNDFILEGRSQTGEPVWALRSRYWKHAGLPQIMRMMSSSSSSS